MNVQDKAITSHQEAEFAVYQWCMKQQLDPSRFTDITAELCKGLATGPIPESALINYITHFALSTKQSEERWGSFARDNWTAASNWAIETVKHLAFVNGAALAGATALVNSPNAYPVNWLISAIGCLGGGLLLALLCMWTETKGYQYRAQDLDRRATSVGRSTTWKSYVEAANEEYKDAGAKWFKASILVGWISAIAALAGVCCIVIAIVHSQVTPDTSGSTSISDLSDQISAHTPAPLF